MAELNHTRRTLSHRPGRALVDEALLAAMPEIVALIAPDGRLDFLSQSAADRLGRANPRRWLSAVPPAARVPMSRALEAARHGRTETVTLDLQVSWSLELRPAGEGRVVCVAPRPDTSAEDTRLREVDHRMKNSLAAISSLMRIQSRAAAHPETQDALRAASLRVLTIGRIHEQLTRSLLAGNNRIDLRAYLVPVVEDLVSSLADERVRLDCGVAAAEVDTATASGIGLIVTELVMNALRHDLASGPGEASLGVSVQRREAGLVVTVRDSGSLEGRPDGLPSGAGIGARIVELYSRAMGATLRADAPPGGGARVVLRVPL